MLEISGSLDRLHLGDLLEWLHLTRATGRLSLSTESATRTFDVVRGRVSFASSSRASERLASWLLRRGVAPRRELLRSLAISQTRGEIFTEVVEREAKIPHGTLIEAGRSLATALASRLLREDRITFSFDPDHPVTDRYHVALDLECSKLIMQAAYRSDTLPPPDGADAKPPASLDEGTLDQVFWRVVDDLEDESIDASDYYRAYRTFKGVGSILNRWVTQGPPLLPVAPADIERVQRRLDAGEALDLESSPTLAWDIMALVNGLDAPGASRASGIDEAWLMAGDDAPMLARLILENSRWHRERREELDLTLRRAALSRAAAARQLATHVGLSEDAAATAAALEVVLLELVVAALSTAPLATVSMQRAALQRLVPLLGHAAGIAAGFPDTIVAALTKSPADHPGTRLSHLVAASSGELGNVLGSVRDGVTGDDDDLSAALAAAHDAARAAADGAGE